MCMLIYKYVYIYIIKMYVNNDWIDLCYFFYRIMVWWF